MSGLRGTGSFDWTVEDVFLPERRTMVHAGVPLGNQWRRWPGVTYALPTQAWVGPHHSAVITGIARAGIDALIELAGEKTPRGRTGRLCENPQVQDAVGRADAILNAGRVYRSAMIGELWNIIAAGEETAVDPAAGGSGDSVMDRRAFIGTLACGLLATPLAAEAQQAAKVPRIGFLATGLLGSSETQASLDAFRQAVPAAQAGLPRAGLGADVLGTEAQARGSEGAEGVDVDLYEAAGRVKSRCALPVSRFRVCTSNWAVGSGLARFRQPCIRARQGRGALAGA